MFSLVLIIIVYLISAVIHEFAHSLSAYLLGDKSQKENKRLTFNLFKHFDIKQFKFKPIKFETDKKYKRLIILSAGLISNFIILLIGLFIYYSSIGKIIIYVNLFIIIVNLIPIYPSDGYKILEGLKDETDTKMS